MKPSKALIIGIGCLALSTLASLAEDAATAPRTWTDSKGRQVTATFVGLQGETISIQTAAGQIFNLPLTTFSAEDQAYAKSAKPAVTYVAVNATVGQAAAAIDQLVVKGLLVGRDKIAKANAVATMETDKRPLPKPNILMTDEQFVRRVYLDIAGRIPNYEEAKGFLGDASPTKRAKLIDMLLDSPGYASNTYNYFAEMLRVKDRLEQDNLRGVPYINWLQKEITANTPWDKLVYQMMTAEGKMWHNGAAGYLLRDSGMPLDNLANTLSVFLGTDVACAQCHDHPFADWTQHQFYEMAAFFGKSDTRARGGKNVRDLSEAVVALAEKGGADPTRIRNGIRNYIGANSNEVVNLETNKVKLPDNYKYKDAKPNDTVEPKFITWSKNDKSNPAFKQNTKGKETNLRESFASWMTHPSNPRFAMAIANRMWKRAFGQGVAEPVTNIDDPEKASNPELLKHLAAEMVRVKFNIKDFMRIVYNTQSYQRESTTDVVPMGEPYYFQGPQLRRMTAEQAWDSYMTLVVGDADKYTKPLEDLYSRSIDLDLRNDKLDAKTVLLKYSAYQGMAAKERALMGGNLGSDDMMMDSKKGKKGKDAAPDMMMENASMSFDGMVLRRASELEQPERGGHFLAEFGQSQRLLIDGGSKAGSVPQVLMLMNGKAQQMLTDKGSLLFKTMEKVNNPADKVEAVFLSVLSRKPTLAEKDIAKRGIESAGADGFSNLIWALINTREFMFIQ
jgi:Protein of unknown function (DUF1549)/Protein of unknown function (DUF1553)